MSKAVLVMDMPNNCMECVFCFEIDEGIEASCMISIEPNDEDLCRAIEDYCQCKPDWCPLNPMPEKKPERTIRSRGEGGIFEIYEAPLPENKGWNDCIDAILGEE